MTYITKKLYRKTIFIIEKKQLYFIEDVVANLPCSKTTFYDHFKIDSDELNHIKEKLEENKIKTKERMREKWYNSSNATLQVSLMKLIGTDEERKALSLQHHDLTTKGNELPKATNVNLNELPTEVLETLLNAAESQDENTDN